MAQDNCFENTPLEDILVCPNDEFQAGLSPEIYFLPKAFLKTFKLPANTSTYAQAATITQDIEPIVGKGFVKMDLQIDLNSVNTNLVGNRGNKKDQTTLNIFIPGTKAEVLGFKKTYKNLPGIYIAKDNNGKKFVIGTKDQPAYIDELDVNTGQGPEDNNGGTGTIIANCNLYEYTGNIPLNPGSGDVEPESIVVYPASKEIEAGESLQMTAVVFPLEASQDVEWSVVGGTGNNIDQETGLLTTESNATGPITVTATSKVKPAVTEDATITISA